MKSMLQRLGLLSLGIWLLLAGCDKEGKNGWLYSGDQDGNFKPITDINGEGGYGYAIVRWNLPEALEALTVIDVSWTNSEQVTEKKKLTHFEDSLYLELEGNDYMFRLTSCGVTGEKVTDSLLVRVPDWKAEPVDVVQKLQLTITENNLYLRWEANPHRAFSKTTFQVYDLDDVLVKTIVRTREESTVAQFVELAYNTSYELRYYSENLAGIPTEMQKIVFKTERQAPNLPRIELDENRRGEDVKGNKILGVYAYSADIKWSEPEVDIDSLRITFTGLKDQTYDFRFKADEKKGWLTFLPGGEVTLLVSAKFKNEEEWSAAAGQNITTKKPTDTYQMRPKNAPSGNGSKMGESFARALGITPITVTNFVYGDLFEKTDGKVFLVTAKPVFLDELELCPTIETLSFNDTYRPTAASQAPVLAEFENLVARLLNLKKIILPRNYGGTRYQEILDKFTKSDYPNLEIVDENGNDIQKD